MTWGEAIASAIASISHCPYVPKGVSSGGVSEDLIWRDSSLLSPMETLKTSLTSARWWVLTGVAMGAGVAGAMGLGVHFVEAVIVGEGAAFVGAFAHVLAAAGGGGR